MITLNQHELDTINQHCNEHRLTEMQQNPNITIDMVLNELYIIHTIVNHQSWYDYKDQKWVEYK